MSNNSSLVFQSKYNKPVKKMQFNEKLKGRRDSGKSALLLEIYFHECLSKKSLTLLFEIP